MSEHFAHARRAQLACDSLTVRSQMALLASLPAAAGMVGHLNPALGLLGDTECRSSTTSCAGFQVSFVCTAFNSVNPGAGSEISFVTYGEMVFGMIEENQPKGNPPVNRYIRAGETIHIPQGVFLTVPV